MAEISVIIPAYNQAAFIAEAIQSVYHQTFVNWELLVVDDGSTDDTQQVLTNFHDGRLRVIRQWNKGVSAARNTGLRHSSAPFVAFLDADDLLMSDGMAVLHEYLLAHPEVSVAVGGRQRVDSSGRRYEDKTDAPIRLGFPELLLENDISVGGAMIRRECLDLVGGFDESLQTNEDWDLWLRLVVAGCRLSRVDKVVVAYRLHAAQVTQDAAKMRDGTLRLWENFFRLPNLPAELLAYRSLAVAAALVRTSARAFRAGEFAVGNSDLVEAIKLDPALCRGGYRRLVDLLRGWANDPQTENAEAYLLAVSNHAPAQLPGLRRQLRKAIAAVILEPFFDGSRDVKQTGTWTLIKAIRYDPSWLINRGVLRMLVDAWFTSPPKKAT